MGTFRPQIVLFGDSLTEWSFGEDKWGAFLADRYARKADVVLRGYCGYNTNYVQYLLDKIFPIPSATPPLLVTVFFGTNDASNPVAEHSCLHVPLAQYKENLHKIVAHLKKQSASTHIVLITPGPISEKKLLKNAPILFRDMSGVPTRRNELARQYAEECVKVAQETGVRVIKMFSVIPEKEVTSDWDEKWFSDNGIHFSPEGNERLLTELVKILDDPGLLPTLRAEEMPWDFPQYTDLEEGHQATFKTWSTPK